MMKSQDDTLPPGVSVVIPSYLGFEYLRWALTSCVKQSLSAEHFEVIVVLNGPAAESISPDSLAKFSQSHTIRVLKSYESGASRARNLGLRAANRQLVTFLDDDDMLQPNFLKQALGNVRPGHIALLPIVNWKNNSPDADNTLNMRISSLAGTTVPISSVPWILGFNACKVFPTALARRHSYLEELKSGEDVAYFANLLESEDLCVTVPSPAQDQAYVRTIREGSVSRQEQSFDFSITQRLQVIAALRKIEVPQANQAALDSLIHSQFGFIQRFLKNHPDQVQAAIEEAVQLGITGLNWEPLRPQKARRLVFSYCFPPYADTSANVAAKVIRAQGELVDVYYAKMDRVRAQDDSTNLIVEPFVVHSEIIDKEPSFAHWPLITAFAQDAAGRATRRALIHGQYETMYSRALWSGSHVAAALYKKTHPLVKWEAEFSDPLGVGSNGKQREGKITPGRCTRTLQKMIRKSQWPEALWETHFELTELVTLIYADEVVFTNQNQQEVMLARYPRSLQEHVKAKSVVRHHLTPTPEMYTLVHSQFTLPTDRINIGYFGNFYANRGVDDVLSAIEMLPQNEREAIRLHIFTSKPDAVQQQIWNRPCAAHVELHEYVPYLEFLNISAQFDALVVTDTDIRGTEFHANPFLPSKYSDYIGAGVPVWGIVNEGSPLSTLKLDYVSEGGHVEEANKVLKLLKANQEKGERRCDEEPKTKKS